MELCKRFLECLIVSAISRINTAEHKEAMFDGWDPFTIEKTFECEIKLDYAKVLEATEEEVKKIVAKSIMDYLRELKMPKKVTDFDNAKFIADLETYFRKEHLID